MYEAYFGLRRNPFGQTPDPDLLFLTEAHRDAAAGLTYAILGSKGFSVLTGDAGTGKTTLLRSVIGQMPAERVQFSLVLNPALSTPEFFETALADFGVKELPSNKAEALSLFEQFLLKVHEAGSIAVLVVDEAHRLSIELLEEIRLLTNFETERSKLLQIVLAGQDELNEMLDRHDMRQLKQRIWIRLAIRPLHSEEVGPYIQHRWRQLSDREPPFGDETVRLIAEASKGIPRVVNSICDNALLVAYALGATEIAPEHIREVARDLHLLNGHKKRPVDTNGIIGLDGSQQPKAPQETGDVYGLAGATSEGVVTRWWRRRIEPRPAGQRLGYWRREPRP
ncbi:MAG: ExeA family protein [Bryobacteraceae bacterium]